MRNTIIILLAIACSTVASSQAHFDGNNIVIDAPVMSGQTDWQINVQNLDNLSENFYVWSDTGLDTIPSPYCNIRISRTQYDYQLLAYSEWSIDLKREPVNIKVSAMPNRKFKVEVSGGYQYQLGIRHSAYGGWYQFMDGMTGYYPNGTFTGTKTFFVPYRIPGEQVANVKVFTGGACDVEVGKIFYIN